jgi:hypothetical protein
MRLMLTTALLLVTASTWAQTVPMPRPRPDVPQAERQYFDYCAHNPASCKPIKVQSRTCTTTCVPATASSQTCTTSCR